MSKVKNNYILNSVTVDLGCISTFRRPKISSVLHPNPKIHRPQTSSVIKSLKAVHGLGCEGVAVEKDSDDPYLDFRHSMLQMILEKQIYAKHDLKELLNCFLQLNPPYYHGIIFRAFTDIWNGVYSVRPANASSPPDFHCMGCGTHMELTTEY